MTNNNFIGIEYSKDRVKCALLQPTAKGYVITDLEIFESDSLNSSLNLFLDWKEKKFPNTKLKAIVSISESTIFLKELTVPLVKKQAIDEAIYWELSSSSPLAPSQAIYEWSEIEKGKNDIKAVAMAARESEISNLIEKLDLSNIEVVAIEPASVSLARVAGGNYSQNTMLVMVGNKETDIVILKNAKPVFSTTSDIPLKRDKEKWKLSQTVADAIAENTNELISFWEEKNKTKIQQVIISGDIVDKYFGLAASINKLAKIPVVIAKEKQISGLKYAELPKAQINRFYVAIGAVVRFGGDPYEGINLLPKEKKNKIEYEISQRLKQNNLKKFNKFAFSLFIMTLLATSFLKLLDIKYSMNLKSLDQKVNDHPANKLVEEVKKDNEILGKLLNITGRENNEGEILRKLSELAPKEIKFTSVVYETKDGKLWQIKGTGSREEILAYYDSLVRGSGAGQVSMPYSNLNNDQENEFEIYLKW